MNRLFFWILTLSLIGAGAPALGATAFEKEVRSALLDVLEKRAVYPNETVLTVRTPSPVRSSPFSACEGPHLSRPAPRGKTEKAQLLPRSVYPPGRPGHQKVCCG